MAVLNPVITGTYSQRASYDTTTLVGGQYWLQTDDAPSNPSGYYQWTGFIWSYDVAQGGYQNQSPANFIGGVSDVSGVLKAAVLSRMTASPTADNPLGWSVGAFVRGHTEINNAFAEGYVVGIIGYGNHYGLGTVTELTGVNGFAQNQNTGPVTRASGGEFGVVSRTSGVITNAYAVFAASPNLTIPSAVLDNRGVYIANQGLAGIPFSAGVYIDPQTLSTAAWAIYSAGGQSYHAGNFQFGGALVYSSEITPTALSGNTNDWNPTGLATTKAIRISASAPVNLTGIQALAAGAEITMTNVGANTITLVNAATSAAANQFQLKANISLAQWGSVQIRYDSTLSKWLCIGTY